MAAIGSLRVELELVDGSFTTRVIRAGTTLRQLEAQTGQTITAIRRLDSSFSTFAGGLRDVTMTLGLARAAFENLNSVVFSLPVSILRAAGEIERLGTLMRGMSTASTEAARGIEGQRATQWIMDLAQRAPFALQTLTEGFVRLQASGINPMAGSMQGLVDAVAAFGGTSQQFDRATVAIQQMAGKGVISLEELRQQLGEAVPNAIPLMARALGVTVDELVRQITQGRVRSEPALRALAGEFERTFGGRALQMMTTFNGQLQILTTNWQRLQVASAGAPGSGGFLDAATEALRKLNEGMSGPDAQGGAIRLGLAFRDLTVWITSTAETLIKFSNQIALGLQIAGYAVAIHLAASALTAMGVALNFVTLGLSAKVAAALRAQFALTSFSAVVGAVTMALYGMVTAMGAMATAGMASLVSGFLGLGAAIRLIPTMLFAIATAASTAFTALTAGMGAAGIAAVGISAAMAPLLAVVALGGVLWAGINVVESLGRALFGAGDAMTQSATAAEQGSARWGSVFDYLGRRLQRYFIDADPSQILERLRLGAADSNVLNSARTQIAQLEEGMARIIETKRRLDTFLTTPNRNPNSSINLPGIDGAGVAANLGGGYHNVAAAHGAQTQILAMERQFSEQLIVLRENLANGERTRQEQLSAQWARARIASLSDGLLAEQRVYAETQAAIAAERVAAAANAALSTDEKTAAAAELQRRNLESRRTLDVAQQRQYGVEIAAAWASLNAAQRGGSAESVANYTAYIAQLEHAQAAITERINQGNVTLGDALTSGTNQSRLNTQTETYIRNGAARVAELTTQLGAARDGLVGVGSEVARVTALLAAGRWGDPGAVITASMLATAKALDDAKVALTSFNAVQEATGRIESGFARAASDFERYAVAMQDRRLPEAQRAFVTYSREMQTALTKIRTELGEYSDEYIAAAARVQEGTFNMRSASVMAQVNELIVAGERARLANLTPAQRLAEEIAQRRVLIETLRNQINALIAVAEAEVELGAAGAEAAGQAIVRLRAALTGLATAEANGADATNRRFGAATARAGAAAENHVTRLTGRIAELNDEIRGGAGEGAKLEAMLTRTGQASSASGQQIIALARQVDALSQRATLARNAWSTLTEISRAGEAAAGRIQEYVNQMNDPNRSEENRQVLSMRARGNQAIEELRRQGNAETQLREQRTKQDEAVKRFQGELAGRQGVQMADQRRQIEENLEYTLEGRRRVATETVNIEESQRMALIAASGLQGQQRIDMENNVANYITARRNQVTRETEGPFQKMIREWGNQIDNLQQGVASAFDKMADGIANFAMTGKMNFADLAKSIVADLIKIQTRAAISGIMRLVMPAAGAAAGGAAGATNYGADTSGTTSFFGNLNHGGGMIGLGERSGIRQLDPSIFDRAPRFHSGGLVAGERAIVAQTSEGVFTAGQMAAIGRMNHSYTAVEAMMARIADAASMPASAAPATNGREPRGQGGNMPPVTVNIENHSKEPLSATTGQPRMDLDGMVIDVIVRNANRPGPMRDAIRGG